MAVLKLSQIAAAGVAPAVTDQAVFVTGGTTDNLVTVNQLGSALPLFTSTTRGQAPSSGGGTVNFLRADATFALPPTFTSTTPGYAPSSGGGTTNFLRADGTFAAPPAGTPGGINTQVQFNNAAAFGGISNVTSNGTNLTGVRLGSAVSLDWDNGAGTVDVSVFRDGASNLAQRLGTTAQSFYVYNTFTSSTSFERGALDWTTVANTLVMGFQKGSGGGSDRNVRLRHGNNASLQIDNANDFCSACFDDANSRVNFFGAAPITFTANVDAFVNAPDTGLGRIAPKVVSINDGTGINANGWIQWQGQARIDADFNTGNSTVLANITGSAKNLSVTLQAGRTYSFRVELFTTSNVAAGVQFAIAGTCTATNIIYEALVDDAAAVKAQTKATALATAVGAVTAVTSAHCNITGTITVNAAGTLTVQAAQNVGNATGTVVQRGSYMIVQDMP